MLPPFVPPSARVPAEDLPLITEFVVDRLERSFESTFMQTSAGEGAVATVEAVAEGAARSEDVERGTTEVEARTPDRSGDSVQSEQAGVTDSADFEEKASLSTKAFPSTIEFVRAGVLPSIEEFVARDPYVESPKAVEVSSAEERADVVAGGGTGITGVEPLVQLQHAAVSSDDEPASEEAAEPADAVTSAAAVASATSVASADTEASEPTQPKEASGVVASVPDSTDDWIVAERDAFDWQSVAHLAAPDNEEQRADEEWTSTDWDAPTSSASENIASMLMQVARRVRVGELKVDVPRGMTTEVALAAVLTALLAEPDTDGGVHGQE